MRTREERETDERLAVLAVDHGWPITKASAKFGVGHRVLRRWCAELGIEPDSPNRRMTTEQKLSAVARIEHGERLADVATDAGVHPVTLWHWLNGEWLGEPYRPNPHKAAAVARVALGQPCITVAHDVGVHPWIVRRWGACAGVVSPRTTFRVQECPVLPEFENSVPIALGTSPVLE